ncbi:MAG TPA: hypothetical protein QF800_04145 [Phycisphaerales bacterium]|jgi:hypothetical protein|nr:hypothetical protein [Phycisphaerales bacterium]
MTTNPPDTEPNTPRSLGQRIGCVTIIMVVAVGIGLVGYEFIRVNRLVANYQHRFATWTQVDASAIDQTEVITEPTFFFASTITLHGSTAEVAMLGGDATLHGQYQGDVHFLGRYFDLTPDAQIMGNLVIQGSRHVTLRGMVKGRVEGSWDRLFGNAQSQTGTTSSDAP